MEAGVEYTLHDNDSQPRACLAVKLPAEVIRCLAQGSSASMFIQTPKGGALTIGDEEYEVTWQNDATVDCYRLLDDSMQQIGPCVGKAVVVPRLDAPKHEEIKSRTDEALERMRKRKVEVMEVGFAPPALEARQMATALSKPNLSLQTAAPQSEAQPQKQQQQSKRRSVGKPQPEHPPEQRAKTTWVCLHSVPVAATRQAVLGFLEGIEVKPNGVHAACWQSEDDSDPSSGVCQVFVECTKVVGAQLALQRSGEEMKITQRSKTSRSSAKTSSGTPLRAVIPKIESVPNMELPWVKAFALTLSDDRAPISSLLASLVDKVPLCSLVSSPLRLSQCSRLRVQQHRSASLPLQQFSQQLQDDLCPDPDVNVYIEAYRFLGDAYEYLRDELLVLQRPGDNDVLLAFASKQADFMKHKWIEMFNRTTQSPKTNS